MPITFYTLETQASLPVTSSRRMEAIVKRMTCYQAIFQNAQFSGSMLHRWPPVTSMPIPLLSEHSWLCSLLETCTPIWCIIPLTRKGFSNIPRFASPILNEQLYIGDPIFRQRSIDECHGWSYVGSNAWYCGVCFWFIWLVFFVDIYHSSGFQTSVTPQQKIYVPPDVIDVIVTLKRSNLVISYGIISTVAICKLLTPYTCASNCIIFQGW